jgi:hypothetical protein
MNNCLFWAVRQWQMNGGAIVVRRSLYGWWPHFLWMAPDGQLWEYAPVDGHEKACPPPLFRGEARKVERMTFRFK